MLKNKKLLLGIFIIISSVLFLWLYLKVFIIKTIEIEIKINQDSFAYPIDEAQLRNELQQLVGESMFSFNSIKLSQSLKSKYNIKIINVSKNFPSTIKVQIDPVLVDFCIKREDKLLAVNEEKILGSIKQEKCKIVVMNNVDNSGNTVFSSELCAYDTCTWANRTGKMCTNVSVQDSSAVIDFENWQLITNCNADYHMILGMLQLAINSNLEYKNKKVLLLDGQIVVKNM